MKIGLFFLLSDQSQGMIRRSERRDVLSLAVVFQGTRLPCQAGQCRFLHLPLGMVYHGCGSELSTFLYTFLFLALFLS
jgi:hypothetical protein